MPNYGIGPIAQSWLQRWEAAQQARYNAWRNAPNPVAGAAAVIGTAGRLLTGQSGGIPAFAAVAKWATGPTEGIQFR